MKTVLFNLCFKIGSLLGEVSSVDADLANETVASGFWAWLINAGTWLWNWIMTAIYTIVKFALNIVDFVQFFVQRLIGVDYWLNAEADLSTLGESDILFRFLFSDQVLRVFRLIIIIAIVLLIIFSIIAIVKSEYASASSGKDNSKKGILKSSLNAIFLVILIPIMLIFGVLASNAVLASLLNAIKPENSNLTLGGQIFVASAYGANRYRTYADDNERNPATYTYTFAYNYYTEGDKHYYVVCGTDIVYVALSADDGQVDIINKLVTQKTLGDADLPTNLSNLKSSKSSYHTFNSLFEPINPSDYNFTNPLFGFIYEFNDDLFIAKFDESSNIDKLAKYHYLKNVMGASIKTSNLGQFQQNNIGDINFFGNIYNSWDALWDGIKNLIDNEEGWRSSGINLDSCSQSNSVVQMAYKTWGLAKQYKGYTRTFASSVTQNIIEWTAQSGVRIPNALYYTNNSSTWSLFDGGENGLAVISQEYDVMADFMDFAVRMGIEAHIVNSQSPLIDWERVNQNNYYVNEETGLIELAVNYENLGTVVYKPTKTEREDQGAVYLMCLYDALTGKYVPIIPNRDYTQNGGSFRFTSSNFNSNSEQGLVIARGIFDKSYGTQPTIITEVFKDADGNVINGSPTYADLGINNSVTNTIELANSLTVAVDNSSQFYNSVITATANGATGSQVIEYTYKLDNLLLDENLSNSVMIDIFKQNVFRENPLGNYSYATNSSRDASVYYSADSSCVYVKLLDASGREIEITLTPKTMNNGGQVLLAQMVVDGAYTYSQGLLNSSYLQQYSNYIYNLQGEPIATSSGDYVLISDYFNNPANYNINASDVYMVFNLSNSLKLNTNSILNLIKVNGVALGANSTVQEISSDSTVNKTRVWTGENKTGNILDIYIYNNNITIIPYQNYRLSTTKTGIANEVVCGLNINQIMGQGVNYDTYVQYNGLTYAMKQAQTSKGETYYYIDKAGSFSETEYVINFYDAYAYRLLNENGTVGNEIGNLKDPDELSNSLTSVKFSLTNLTSNITDNDGNILYGVEFSSSGDYRTAYVYSGGNVVLKITINDPNKTVKNFEDIIALQTANREVDEIAYITQIAYKNVNYKAVPVYSQDVVDFGISAKPDYIQFMQQNLSTDFFAWDINFANAAIRLYARFFKFTDVANDYVSYVNNGSFYLDYNFNSKIGLSLKNLYMPAQLNIIVLLFATIIVFKILMQSAWGLIKRIYDITILFMVMPGFAAMLPMDGGTRFGKWKDKLIKSIFGAYGVMLGLNIFFVLVPIINNATSNIFTYADLPSTIVNNFLFSRPDYLNQLVNVMFTLVALTLLQTLPKFISDILEFGDVYDDGGKVRKDVGGMVKDVTNVTTGKKALATLDAVAPVGKDGKRHPMKGMLSNYIPGSAIASSLWDKYGAPIRDGLSAKEAQPKEEKKKGSSGGGETSSSAPSNSPTPPDNAGHSSMADVAGTARNVTQFEQEDYKEFKGSGNHTATSLQDTEASENNMAKFAQEFENAKTAGDQNGQITAYQGYEKATNEWVKENVNNAMFNGEGEFTTNEKSLAEINKNLGDGYEARAYRTNETDAVTGEAIWAVKIGKKDGIVSSIDNNISNNAAREANLQSDISNFDTQLKTLGTDLSVAKNQYNSALNERKTVESEIAQYTNADGLKEFNRLSSENDKHNKFIQSFNEGIANREANNVQLQNENSRIDKQIADLQAKYNIREQIIPGYDKDKDKWLSEIKNLQQQKADNENLIAKNNAQINDIKVSRNDRINAVKENNEKIKTLLGGDNASKVNSLIDRQQEASRREQETKAELYKVNKQYATVKDNKIKAEKDLGAVQAERANLYKQRETAVATSYRNDANDAATKYNTAIKQQDHLTKLEKVVNSGIPQKNKDEAINKYVDTYYKNASSSEKQKIANDLKTSAGMGRAKTRANNAVKANETIANGSTAKANKITKQNLDSPIKPKGPNGGGTPPNPPTGGGGGTPPPPTGGGNTNSHSTTSSNSGASSSQSSSSSSSKPKGSYVNKVASGVKKVVTKASKTATAVKNAANNAGTYIKETFTKPKTQGDELRKQYAKQQKAEQEGKTSKVKRIGKKMVKIAAKGEKMRQKADNEYIESVNASLGTNAQNVEEAKAEAQKAKNQTHVSIDAKGSPVSDKTDRVIEELEKAENKRAKSYNKSSVGATKHSKDQQNQADVLKATREFANKEREKQDKELINKTPTVKKVRKSQTTPSSLGDAVRVSNDLINGNGDAKTVKKATKAREKYKNSDAARAIRSLNIDDHLGDKL